MTNPRPVYPGQTYLLTRRVVLRHFRLTPSPKVNQAYWYILGHCAQKYDIDIFAALSMSNHHHVVLRDNHGQYPCFLHAFHSLLARCINAAHGDTDTFWCGAQPSMVCLRDSEKVLDAIVYTVTNPVKDQLVSRANAWPGATSFNRMLDNKPLVVKRPDWFFLDKPANGREVLPAEVTIKFKRPPEFEHLSHEEWTTRLKEQVGIIEDVARVERAKTGRSVLGAIAARKQRRDASPASLHKRGGMNPRVAARDKSRRMERIKSDKQFVSEHRCARLECVDGKLAMFPPGTWAVHRHFKAKVAPVDMNAPGIKPLTSSAADPPQASV